MSTSNYSEVVDTARQYYNSDDADSFYHTIWGGEDIHIGLYSGPESTIFDASRKTVMAMAEKISNDGRKLRVLDLGAGYGGAARYLAKTFGWQVVALNLSEKENERNRRMNAEQNLDHLIEVVDASFEEIPYPDNSFDVVWSQDAILHSGNRETVLAEVARVLKPEGEFIFTDIMQAEDVPKNELQPVYDRIHLSSLGSLGFYRSTAATHGMAEVAFHDHQPQLATHYDRVLQETEKREPELQEVVSRSYLEHMKNGLKKWIEAGQKGHLNWGIFHFKKQ